jgi:hypothetical protein
MNTEANTIYGLKDRQRLIELYLADDGVYHVGLRLNFYRGKGDAAAAAIKLHEEITDMVDGFTQNEEIFRCDGDGKTKLTQRSLRSIKLLDANGDKLPKIKGMPRYARSEERPISSLPAALRKQVNNFLNGSQTLEGGFMPSMPYGNAEERVESMYAHTRADHSD